MPRRFASVVATATVIAGLVVYAFLVEPCWVEIASHDLRKLPEGERVRVVQISDLHLQEVTDLHVHLVEQVRTLAPDLVVLSGDVLDRDDRLLVLEEFLALLSPLSTVATLGNWEHWSGLDLQALRSTYEIKGVRLLINEAASYRIRSRTLMIFGMDDFTAGSPSWDRLGPLPDVDTTLLVQHSPGFFERSERVTKPGGVSLDLCLAGHTHGGQITLFGLPVWTPSGSGPFQFGFYDTPLCKLYVSKGVGTSLIPARFGARPELAVFDL